MEKLTEEELSNLSQLLLSANENNIELGMGLLQNYTNAVRLLYRVLMLIWQLNENKKIRKKSHKLLKSTYTKMELKELQKGFKLFSKIADVYTYKPKVLKWINAHEHIRGEYAPLMEQNSNYTLKYHEVAYQLHQYLDKHLDVAETYYRIALKKNPKKTSVLLSLASLLSESSNGKKEAVELYLKGLEFRPKSITILNRLGELYEDLELLDLAYDCYLKTLKLDPNCGVHMGEVGKKIAKIKGEKYKKEAKTLFLKSVEVAPNSTRVWLRLGNYLWLNEQDYDGVEKAYLGGLKVDPNDSDLIGNLGELYIDIRGEYDKGLALYKQAIEIKLSRYRLITMVTLLIQTYNDYEQGKYYYKELIDQYLPDKITKATDLTEIQWNNFLEAEQLLLATLD